MKKLINISQLSLLLNLINKKTKKPSTHILRYWEKEFWQIKPIIINTRRYYSQKQIDIVKLIKFLLKEQGLTINGAKNVLKLKINTLDDYDLYSLKASKQKENFKIKTKKIQEKINKLRGYGKKNTH